MAVLVEVSFTTVATLGVLVGVLFITNMLLLAISWRNQANKDPEKRYLLPKVKDTRTSNYIAEENPKALGESINVSINTEKKNDTISRKDTGGTSDSEATETHTSPKTLTADKEKKQIVVDKARQKFMKSKSSTRRTQYF